MSVAEGKPFTPGDILGGAGSGAGARGHGGDGSGGSGGSGSSRGGSGGSRVPGGSRHREALQGLRLGLQQQLEQQRGALKPQYGPAPALSPRGDGSRSSLLDVGASRLSWQQQQQQAADPAEGAALSGSGAAGRPALAPPSRAGSGAASISCASARGGPWSATHSHPASDAQHSLDAPTHSTYCFSATRNSRLDPQTAAAPAAAAAATGPAGGSYPQERHSPARASQGLEPVRGAGAQATAAERAAAAVTATTWASPVRGRRAGSPISEQRLASPTRRLSPDPVLLTKTPGNRCVCMCMYVCVCSSVCVCAQ